MGSCNARTSGTYCTTHIRTVRFRVSLRSTYRNRLQNILPRVQEYAKFCNEQLMPLTKLKGICSCSALALRFLLTLPSEIEPVCEVFAEIAAEGRARTNAQSTAPPLTSKVRIPRMVRPITSKITYRVYQHTTLGELSPPYTFLLQVCSHVRAIFPTLVTLDSLRAQMSTRCTAW